MPSDTYETTMSLLSFNLLSSSEFIVFVIISLLVSVNFYQLIALDQVKTYLTSVAKIMQISTRHMNKYFNVFYQLASLA